ncbi:fatty acid desaturase [Rhodobacteraceae bacterium NNCM2]|nr:fatty acid desaturase [Coraliihabitans acroporae]
MDHKEFLAGLTAEQRLTLTAKSDRPGLVHLAGHWGAIAMAGGLIAAKVPGWPLLLPIQGVLLVFLFTLLHETSHRTPFASEWLNVWVGRVSGFAILLPPEWFRLFHMAHHRYTNDPARDPELAEGKPETWRGYLVTLSGLPVWRSHIETLIRCAAGRVEAPYLPASSLPRIRREAQGMVALYLALAVLGIAMGADWLIWAWLVPLLLGQPFLRLYLLAEHGRCPPVANMFENTRTTFTTRLVRFLAWNMPYHAEHHALPTVPFHRLPVLHGLANPHLKVTERGYWRFHRAYQRWLGKGTA